MEISVLKLRQKFAQKYSAKPAIDTQAESRTVNYDNTTRHDILQQAQQCWESLDYWRRQCKRNQMFVDGDQWGDYTHFFDEKTNSWRSTSERSLLIAQGCIPLTNNILIAIIRTVMGLFVSNQTEPIAISRTRGKQEMGEIMSATIQYVYQKNKLWDLDRDTLKEFITNGAVFGKMNYAKRNGKRDIYFDNVPYYRMFFDNTMEDKRHWDCNIIGSCHDVALVDVIAWFAKDRNGNYSETKAAQIRSRYGNRTMADETVYYDSHTRNGSADDDFDFYSPTGANAGKCRVIEIWRKERKERLYCYDKQNVEEYYTELSDLPNIERENQKRLQEIKIQVAQELQRSFNSLQPFIDCVID